MKKTTILISLISLLLSCNENNTSDLLKEEIANENINELTESSFYGAWKYEDSKFGTVFVQFEMNGIVKAFISYEGESLGTGKWEFNGNQIKIIDCYPLVDMVVNDFDGDSFKTQDLFNEFVVFKRLKDEAGEPILYYSLFEREPKPDPRYDNSEISTIDNESSSYGSSEHTSVQKQWVNCKYCHGTGLEKCRTCKGRGQISVGNGSAFGNSPGFHMENCYTCGGRGLYDNCSTCDGRGQVQE